MEPVTHGLTSLALARAGLNKTSRWGTAILLVSGYVSDLDWLSLLGGPPAMLAWRRVPGHSFLGGAVLAAVVAAAFWWFGRGHPTQPLRFNRAMLLSLIGVGSHLLLDLPNRYGCQLLWPFRDTIHTWANVESIDPWPLFFLLLGLLLPALFRLVSEEIGARKETRGPRNGAIFALLMITLYFGGRAVLKHRAEQTLGARLYGGAAPLAVAAYPKPFTPFVWQGVVETENTYEEFDVPVLPGGYFNPESGTTHFKPDDSPALQAARKTPTVQRYLHFARFPIARTMRLREGYEVNIRDVRFHGDGLKWAGFAARVELDNQFKVVNEEIVAARPGAGAGPPD